MIWQACQLCYCVIWQACQLCYCYGLRSLSNWKIIVAIVLDSIATISSNKASILRHNESIIYDNIRCKQIDRSTPYPYAASFPSHNISYIPLGGYRFEEYKCGDTPYNVTAKDKQNSDKVANVRRLQVKKAMQFMEKLQRTCIWHG